MLKCSRNVVPFTKAEGSLLCLPQDPTLSDSSQLSQNFYMHFIFPSPCPASIACPDSIVGVVTKLYGGWSSVQLLAAARDFFLVQIVQAGPGTHPASYSVTTLCCSPPGVKWPWHEADQSPQPRAEFQNELSCTSSPPSCLHCVYGENFTFYFFILVIFCEKEILWSSPWYKCI
jgi:hypothetical protein